VVLCGGWVCVGVCVCVWCGVVWCVCVCLVVAESVCGYAHLFVGVNVSFRVDRKDIFGYVSACTSLSRRVSVTECGVMCVCVCVCVCVSLTESGYMCVCECVCECVSVTESGFVCEISIRGEKG